MTRALRRAREMLISRRAPARWSIAGAVATLSIAAAGHAQAAAPGERAIHAPAPASAVQASASPLARPITLELVKVPLAEALRAIDQRANLGLAFTSQTIPAKRIVSLSAHDMPAGEALKRVLAGTGVVVRETPSGQIMLVKAEAPERRSAIDEDTTGHAAVLVHVVDTATMQPLKGAVVGVRGTRLMATTTEQGYALLRDVPSGLRVVTVRFLGYAPADREVVVPDSGYLRLQVLLRMGMTRLQDVVTTATGPQRRMDIPNDVTMINADSITATQPIASVTDLLEGRVPGLVVQHTSGAPGDPSRLRLRGASSVLRSNDPIVVIDGVRIYAAQSDSTSANLASNGTGGFFGTANPIAAPSPLDQIDPQSIETIEVLKGPSAATLYGPDAANGVIVITTKKGRAGPAQWTVSASHGLSYMPGNYPEGIYRWGASLKTSKVQLCTLTQFDCQADSVVRFQALNDPRYSVLDQGADTKVSLGVSGGTDALTYALTGSYADQTGILKLPDIEAARFRAEHGGASPPDWMQRPQQLTRWSGTSRLTARINDHTNASLSTTLTRETQQRSSLERQLATLMATYIDPVSGTIWRGSATTFSPDDALLPDFYQRATDDATNFTNAANITWRPKSWLTTSADAGINVISRSDEVLLPRGLSRSIADSAGRLNIGHGSSVVSTVNARATATAPLPLGFRLQFATGANYTKTTLSSIMNGASGLRDGTSSINGAGEITTASQTGSDVTSFGWYVEPSFTHKRFTISTGLRLDGSSTFGTNVKLPAFPKLGGSWLISEEPFFPLKNVFDVLRIRAAYGRAGVWPGEADRLRLYTTSRVWLDDGFVEMDTLLSLGNSALRPERSTEIEGGFDADMFGDRLSVSVTGYRKMRYDALMSVPVAPSVYGRGIEVYRNIGEIRNTGLELSVSAQLVRSAPVTWSTTVNLSRNHNMVTKLGQGVQPFGPNDARVVAGYPLFGRWAKPILGYSDVNGNGVIEASEVLLGDTALYMGASEPNYEASLSTSLSLFRGAVTVGANFTYQDGLTQENNALFDRASNVIFSPGLSDPSSSFAEQAAVAVMQQTDYGLLQTVNTLRLNSLSVAFNASPRLARRFGTKALSVALQGTNVGLWTNYAGKDPNVNAAATGNKVFDTGVLPMPRAWMLAVRATY
ncbi:MAG: SusC/RagA family TonB-linked outer membrane protein [Gemmatimonadaceae bacterium]|nr:SusC/RagA family TonB-linked outer membrane protein [Gemmatimonadaceae bacterium]